VSKVTYPKAENDAIPDEMPRAESIVLLDSLHTVGSVLLELTFAQAITTGFKFQSLLV